MREIIKILCWNCNCQKIFTTSTNASTNKNHLTIDAIFDCPYCGSLNKVSILKDRILPTPIYRDKDTTSKQSSPSLEDSADVISGEKPN